MWVDSKSSVASIVECLRYGGRRRVLMHAWLNSVHWDATRKVCEASVSKGGQGRRLAHDEHF